MKRKIQFIYPAVFVKDEDNLFQVFFPDLNIFAEGKDLSEAFLNAKDTLFVYFNYVMKYETEYNTPTKLQALIDKCKPNETIMYIDAVVEVDV